MDEMNDAIFKCGRYESRKMPLFKGYTENTMDVLNNQTRPLSITYSWAYAFLIYTCYTKPMQRYAIFINIVHFIHKIPVNIKNF